MSDTPTPQPQPVFDRRFYIPMACLAVLTVAYVIFDFVVHGEVGGPLGFLAVVAAVTGIGYLGDTGRIPGDQRDRLQEWKSRQG